MTDARILGLIADLKSEIGTHEVDGTNRGPKIDAWADEFGSPLGSPWCALFGGHVRKKNGLWIPNEGVGSCDEWVYAARKAGKWSTQPSLGAAIIYTNREKLHGGRYEGQWDAVHLSHIVASGLEIAGNTSDDRGFNRDGGCVAEKLIAWNRVYGYVLP